ncbi:terminase large subunit [Aristophania vespae]|uniref:terminase large subunit n=1 Tax=Aristophania vespae TaxID=2697033 RepID=UPI002351882F|nr:terminase large subunit [Aristophania vespae]UMM63106.1 hypothetical protein DM15PD_00600 [Aristophania vespae]
MLDFSCHDWADRLKNGLTLMPDFKQVNPSLASDAIEFFNGLKIPDIPGQPLCRDAVGPWFREIVGALHGSLDPVTGERLIREIFLLVPKKNSKTTNGAALMLTSVLVNKRPNAEFLIVAPTKDIADLAFKQAMGMVTTSPSLMKCFKIQQHIKCLTFKPTGATLKVKSFAADVLTGVRPSGVLLDEEHIISLKADAQSILGQIRGGLISQPEAFLIIITTQSDRPPRGVFKDDLATARAVRDGKITGGSLLPILYEFPEEIQKPATLLGESAPWEDSKYWHMVLPNAGRSLTIKRLEEDFHSAKEKGAVELARWASQHLNVEIGLALRSDKWAGVDYWQAQTDPTLTLDEIIKRSEVIVAGVDGGGLDDLLSLAVIGRDKDSKKWLAWCKNWVFSGVLELRKQEASQLQDFQKDGDLVIIEEPGNDIENLTDILADLHKTGLLSLIGFDPMGVGAIVDLLISKGIPQSAIVGVSQGWQLSGAIKTTERKLVDGSLKHAGQPILGWAASNAKVEPRGNAIIITKQAAGYLKIDPLMALFDAVTLMSKNPNPSYQGSVDGFLQTGLMLA